MNSYIKSIQNSNNAIVLALITKDKGEHIGNIALQSINWISRSGEIAFLLGDKNAWGKGYMEEAGKLLMQHAFTNLALHRIYCGTVKENIGMNKLALKLGMQHEGSSVDAFYKNGRYHDIEHYAIINKSDNK